MSLKLLTLIFKFVHIVIKKAMEKLSFLDSSVKSVDNVKYAFLSHQYKNESSSLKMIKEQELLYDYKVLDDIKSNLKSVPFKTSNSTSFSFIDLFAGVGGFRLALQNLGGECTFSSEWEISAQKTYFKNYGEVPFGDISKEEIKSYIPKSFDILCAGFPCQPFSIAGEQKGFNDARGTLFFDIEKITEIHRPKVLFLENVKNFFTHDKGNTFKTVKAILEQKLNYKVHAKVLNSMTHANIPQNRERIFIIAIDKEQVSNFNNFTFPNEIKLTKTIHDILDKDKKEDKYYYQPEHKYFPELIRSVKSRDTIYQWRRVYVRENKSNVCPTLTANMGLGGHNVPIIKDEYGIRKLTPKECFKFQGYPDNFLLPDLADSKLYHQAGNSVTVPLIERIFQEIINIL